RTRRAGAFGAKHVLYSHWYAREEPEFVAAFAFCVNCGGPLAYRAGVRGEHERIQLRFAHGIRSEERVGDFRGAGLASRLQREQLGRGLFDERHGVSWRTAGVSRLVRVEA